MPRIEEEKPNPPHQSSPFVYDLRLDESSSRNYFTDVAGFAETVLEQTERRAGSILDRFVAHTAFVLEEHPGSRGEAAADLLTIGAVTSLYMDSARKVPGWVLTQLQELTWKRVRPALTTDILRDALDRTFMKVEHSEGARRRVRANPEIVLDELPHLIEWLACTTDLAEFSRCMINWSSLLRTLPRDAACHWIESAQELFEWFEAAAEEALGGYTRGVSGFLAGHRSGQNSRRDRFLRGRKPVEYHLAMVAAEIGNRRMRPAFNRRSRKLVVVPACMRGVNAPKCPGGQSVGLPVTCSECDPACAVCGATRLLQKSGTDVYVENCSRERLRLTTRFGQNPHTGVVVVACLANMRSIQLAARAAHITCQFLPLDFPGCQSHWRKSRCPTSVNEGEFFRIVSDVSPHPG